MSRAVFDCRGVSVAKVSANQRFIAYGTLQGRGCFSFYVSSYFVTVIVLVPKTLGQRKKSTSH